MLIKSLSLTPGSKLMVPRSIPTSESKFKMMQILEHLFSKLTSQSFKLVSFQSRKF